MHPPHEKYCLPRRWSLTITHSKVIRQQKSVLWLRLSQFLGPTLAGIIEKSWYHEVSSHCEAMKTPRVRKRGMFRRTS